MEVEAYAESVIGVSSVGWLLLLDSGRKLFVPSSDWNYKRNEPKCVGDCGWVFVSRKTWEAEDGC